MEIKNIKAMKVEKNTDQAKPDREERKPEVEQQKDLSVQSTVAPIEEEEIKIQVDDKSQLFENQEEEKKVASELKTTTQNVMKPAPPQMSASSRDFRPA